MTRRSCDLQIELQNGSANTLTVVPARRVVE